MIVEIMMIAGCSFIDVPPRPNPAFLQSTGPLPGYLVKGEHPDSSALLPPPPVLGSVAFSLDEQLNRQSLQLRGSSRWKLAAADAETRFPGAASTFSCALGVPISKPDTPSVYIILRRSVVDAGNSVRSAKKHYQRERPFIVNEQPICTPTASRYLDKDGSYPSGHATAGWAWALILAEIAPEQASAVLARGWAFGQSRAVCNVHWQSDIAGGRVVAAALVARLHANADFRADIAMARKEIAAVRARGLPPNRDCEAEANALTADVAAD